MVKFVVAMEFVSLAVLVSAIFTGITRPHFFSARFNSRILLQLRCVLNVFDDIYISFSARFALTCKNFALIWRKFNDENLINVKREKFIGD